MTAFLDGRAALGRVVPKGPLQGVCYASRASSDLYTARVATATLSGENMYSANSRARAHMA